MDHVRRDELRRKFTATNARRMQKMLRVWASVICTRFSIEYFVLKTAIVQTPKHSPLAR